MTADRWAARRLGAVLCAGGLLLSGCASMPGSGPVQTVDSPQQAEADSQVRVIGVSPTEGAEPQQILRGFLEAVTSDEPRFATAREYLTPQRRREWDPLAGTTVLSAGPEFDTPSAEGEVHRIHVSGTRLAEVDDTHVYEPEDASYRESFVLRKVEEEWRIAELPDGLVMREADFRRIYRSVDTYHYADLGAEETRLEGGGEVLVADPVYVRRRINPVDAALTALLDGPSSWLDHVVTTAAPVGARLARGRGPVIDEAGRVTVRLARVSGMRTPVCERLAAQILYTVRDLASVEVTEAEIRAPGRTGCTLLRAETEISPGRLAGRMQDAYFLGEERELVSVRAGSDDRHHAVRGPLGSGEEALRSAAVSRDEEWAAGVSGDGSRLYVAPMSGDELLPEPAYETAPAGRRGGLSTPSWDGLGDLWVAERSADGSRLLRLAAGGEQTEEIPVEGLRSDQRIESLRVASDGVRIAMLISRNGQTALRLGRIERADDAGGGVQVRVDGLRTVTPQLESVAAVSWAGDSALVIVGRPRNGVEQLQYVATDGSFASTPSVPGPNDVTGVAAAEEESRPLLAETTDAIARLGSDAQWTVMTTEGTGPFYPG